MYKVAWIKTIVTGIVFLVLKTHMMTPTFEITPQQNTYRKMPRVNVGTRGNALSPNCIVSEHIRIPKVKIALYRKAWQCRKYYNETNQNHDDVIQWKHFSCYWPFLMRSFDVFFDLRLNKRFSKQSRRLWFEMQSRSFWRYCNDASFSNLHHIGTLQLVNRCWDHTVSEHQVITQNWDVNSWNKNHAITE